MLSILAAQRIVVGLCTLRGKLGQPPGISDIARKAGMSDSSFRVHFKRATELPPIKYQKHPRVRQARRLLMNTDTDVASAGFKVEYGDASHCNREHKLVIDEPPLCALHHLRTDTSVANSAD